MRKHATAIGRALALGMLALSDVVLVVLAMVTLALSFGLGMIFLFPAVAWLIRHRTMLARRLNGTLLGVETQAPYRPEPLPTRPQPDGWYRHDRRLYRTPRWPDWNKRWMWMFSDPATWRDGLWLLLNPVVGGALLLPFVVIGYCLVTPWQSNPFAMSLGLGVAVAAVAAMPWALREYGRWNRLLLAPTAISILANRVQRLDQVRLDAVDSQAAELRRIERDLHDGAQARLVAMGMTLGAVEELMEKDPVAAKVLLGKVREASSTALTEIRGLVRGIHPPVLAERGLGDAVRALALDSPLKVKVTVDLKARPESPVESAAYFSISELLANAARHGGADRVWIDISGQGRALRVTVVDDGSGGADPIRGSGLRGIERRLAAFDGVLAVSSPPGGPTTATFDLPTALSLGDNRDKQPKLPLWKTVIVVIGWGIGWLPLFPQGLVAMVFKLLGRQDFSWFYALYLPERWQWPAIIFNVVLGVSLYAIALLIPIRHSRRRWMAEATPSRLWFCT
ncbi:sensor histidine kinase [Streptosporangium lutulentum]|uniref:histidine kinase n=1 Tax=Streptosporangium lutulentum TaxID=1461250 RepID=A0ABT9QMM6_9ACTN|nr:histidine kinase [Streptosporangium lutulentum]MDP9847972.1 signal transduction histidine kinase [Streptosporangium lutulentum]